MIEQADFLQEAIAVFEQGVLKPIELNDLVVRINSLASVYHFAFGDKNDRELAITEWVAALNCYPDWAIKQAIDELIQTYKPNNSPLTPAILIDKIKSYIKLPYQRMQNYQKLYSNGKIWNTKQEYVDFLKSESARKMQEAKAEREQKEQNARAAAIILEQNNKEFEEKNAETQKTIEAEQQRQVEERKAWKEKIAADLDKWRDNKRMLELIDEFEQVYARMEAYELQ